MVCKMLFFDYKDSTDLFFEKNKLENFDIKFFKEALNNETVNNLSSNDLEYTNSLSIGENSKITPDILNKFRNLRVITTRTNNYSHIDIASCIDKNIAVVNVEHYDPNSPYYNLNQSFKGVTSVLCGCKEYRVV